MKKLAIVTTHPIQYYAPLFKLLAQEERIILEVFYTWGKQSLTKFDPGFKQTVEWDIPILDGYDYEFLTNTASKPGSYHFKGIDNPDAIAKLRQFNPHAILVFGWSYKSHLQILRYFKGKTSVWFRGDSTLLDLKPGIRSLVYNTLKKHFLRWVYRHVDKVFYVGTNNKTYFETYGLKTDQLFFAPHSIDNMRFSKKYKEEALSLRKKLNIDTNEIMLLYAGKFEHKKDPVLLLKAFNDLNRPDTHLVFVGNGELEDRLKLISSHSVSSGRVHFLDFQNQQMMPIIYQACDLFCLPSKGPGETWGLAVNEAMACGKAILASDKVGSAIDLVHAGRNGYIFNAENKNDILIKLKELCDKTKLKSFGANSETIIKKWTFDHIVTSLIKELEK